MKTNKILKIITFIIISSIILVILFGASKAEANELKIDTSFDKTLESINTILEKNEQYESVDKIIKNIKFNTTSHTIRVFSSENNDTQIMNAKTNRVSRIEKIINQHRINFLNANFNLL